MVSITSAPARVGELVFLEACPKVLGSIRQHPALELLNTYYFEGGSKTMLII